MRGQRGRGETLGCNKGTDHAWHTAIKLNYMMNDYNYFRKVIHVQQYSLKYFLQPFQCGDQIYTSKFIRLKTSDSDV